MHLNKIRLPGRVRIHPGLRTQILFLGITGMVVVGAIYLVGLKVKEDSREIAERFGRLESLTAKVSESLLQGREIAGEYVGILRQRREVAAELHRITQSLLTINQHGLPGHA